MTYCRYGLPATADANQDTIACGPRTLDGMTAHVVNHLVVHALGCPSQRQFAQRRQVAGLEVMPHRAFRL